VGLAGGFSPGVLSVCAPSLVWYAMEGDAIPTPHQRRTQASRARAGTRGARPLCSPAVASYRQRPARFATGALVRDRGVLSYRAIPTSTAAKRILAARIARIPHATSTAGLRAVPPHFHRLLKNCFAFVAGAIYLANPPPALTRGRKTYTSCAHHPHPACHLCDGWRACSWCPRASTAV
jgi:hypothetical protein